MIEVVIKRSGLTSDKVDPTDPMSYITRYDHMYWILMLISYTTLLQTMLWILTFILFTTVMK